VRRGFRVGGIDEILIVLRGSMPPDEEVDPIGPEAAFLRVDEWFPERRADRHAESILDDLCRALGSDPPGGDPSMRRDRVRRALLDGALVASHVRPKRGWAPATLASEPPPAAPVERRLVDLWVRLDLPPEEASREGDRFVVTSTDGAYKQTRTVKDDHLPDDASVDLEYTDLDPRKSYSLQIVPQSGSPYYVFRDVPYPELGSRSPPPPEYRPGPDDPLPEEIAL
jgi:hypothetical protein